LDKDRHTEQRGRAPGGAGLPQRPRLGRQLMFWVFLMGAVLLALSLMRGARKPVEEKVDIATFNQHLSSGHVEKIAVKGDTARALLVSGKIVKTTFPEGYVSEHLDAWLEQLPQGAAGEDVLSYDGPSGMVSLLMVNLIPIVLLVVIMIYLVNRQMRAVNPKGGGFPFIRNGTQHARKEKPNVRFDDVAGIQEAKEEVKEIVEFLKNPERFQKVGGRIPRGVLLVGAPGTGKTLLAKAIAGEADVPFFSLCGSDFVELFVGVGASRVRDLFQKARENQPCIIFLDEIDAVGRKRGAGLGGGHDEREQTLNAILNEMDGFARDEGVIVLAATNRPDVLDHALLRPGRFDREIVVDMPDLKGREEILKIHTRRVKLAQDVDLSIIARGTPGFSGADLEAVVNEAAILAVVKNKDTVSLAELEEARDKVRFGRIKQGRVMSDKDRQMTSYHESGHALVAKIHPDVEPLHKVTIVPRGVALGMTMILPEKDRYDIRKKECLGLITMHMAGRVAEEMFCDDISSGAKNDIEVATELARKMVTQWGMSDNLGPVSYSDEEEHVFLGTEITRGKKYSERMAQEIDTEVRGIVNSCYQEARRMCQEHSAQLQLMAKALLVMETLTAEDVQHIFEGETVEDLLRRRDKARQESKKPAEQEAEPAKGHHLGGAEDYPRPAESPA